MMIKNKKHILTTIVTLFALHAPVVWAGSPDVVSTPTDFGLTFNTSNCSVGQNVIASNSATTIDDLQSYNSTYILRVVEPNGGGNHIIGSTYTVDPVANITANSLTFNNTVSHSTGETLEVRLLCEPSPANTSGSNCGTISGAQINGGTSGLYPNEIVASMTYSCAASPVGASAENNVFLLLLALGLGAIGAGLLFRKQTV